MIEFLFLSPNFELNRDLLFSSKDKPLLTRIGGLIPDPELDDDFEGFVIFVAPEVLSKYNQVIACVCFDKKQTKQVPLSFMGPISQEIYISDIYEYELSKSIEVYCMGCDNTPPYGYISSNTVEIEIPPKKDAVLIPRFFNKNGIYKASADNADGYSIVTINVPDKGEGILNSLIDRSITTMTSDITSIGKGAFSSCAALTKANFPKVKSIGDNAFIYCSKLTENNFPEVTSIGNNAFYGCSSLTEADFPKLTKIAISAFASCSALAEINFPKVTYIDKSAFNVCIALTKANFPKVKSIVDDAFLGCSNLTEINFPEATNIGDEAFRHTSLTKADFPKVTYIGRRSFDGCTALTEVNFPKVMSIWYEAFLNCTSLTKADFQEVTQMRDSAFDGCTALTEANFPKLSSIPASAFLNCTSLTEVNFPKVTWIGAEAFSNCRSIQYFDMSEVAKVPTISNNTFNGTTCIFLFRDQTQLNEYASATNWSALANRFQIKGATT